MEANLAQDRFFYLKKSINNLKFCKTNKQTNKQSIKPTNSRKVYSVNLESVISESLVVLKCHTRVTCPYIFKTS